MSKYLRASWWTIEAIGNVTTLLLQLLQGGVTGFTWFRVLLTDHNVTIVNLETVPEITLHDARR